MFGCEKDMKSNDLLKSIRNRRTIRVYNKKRVSRQMILKVLETGRWSPSVHNSQPWRFVVLEDRSIVNALVSTMMSRSDSLLAGFDIIAKETARIILGAPVVIVVYNACDLSRRVQKFEEPYFSVTQLSEVQSISAAIQNMLLAAHCFGLGSAWLTSPLFFNKEVTDILKIKGTLIAILTFGHSAAPVIKTKRKELKEFVEIL